MGFFARALRNTPLLAVFLGIGLVPMILAVFFGGRLALQGFERQRAYEQLSARVEIATQLSLLVHEQQKERGASSVFLGTDTNARCA